MRLLMMLGIGIALLCLPVKAELLNRKPPAWPGGPPASPDDAPAPNGLKERPTGMQEVLNGGVLIDCPVVEVTSSSITIFYKGSSGWRTHINGKREWEVVPSRRVRLSVKNLADGGPNRHLSSFSFDERYPLTAVQVGDRVSLGTSIVDGRYVCTGICIERRPGGRVPRAPLDDLPDDDFRHHWEGANALQDLEENGIPLPLKYRCLRNSPTLPPHLRADPPPPPSPASPPHSLENFRPPHRTEKELAEFQQMMRERDREAAEDEAREREIYRKKKIEAAKREAAEREAAQRKDAKP